MRTKRAPGLMQQSAEIMGQLATVLSSDSRSRVMRMEGSRGLHTDLERDASRALIIDSAVPRCIWGAESGPEEDEVEVGVHEDSISSPASSSSWLEAKEAGKKTSHLVSSLLPRVVVTSAVGTSICL